MLPEEFEPEAAEIDGIWLTGREQLVLVLIIQHRESHFGMPPSQRELLNNLNNKLLPKPGKPQRFVSTQQTHRIADALRNKRLLLDPKNEKRIRQIGRNLIPTPHGERIAQKLIEQSRKAKDELAKSTG